MKKVVLIASDHAGFLTKEKLKDYLLRKKYTLVDFSPKLIKGDDYPDYAFLLGKEVSSSGNLGILVCGTGAGMTIAANKVKGIRAVEAYDTFTSKLAREHNDANVLSLSGRHIPFDKIKQITNVFLETKFSNEERHKRRIKKIRDYERGR
jgi:ribose 5-phosphate isomerase B